jgi:hypothetical protein
MTEFIQCDVLKWEPLIPETPPRHTISKNPYSLTGKVVGWGGHFVFPYKEEGEKQFFQPLNPFV